MEKQFNFVYITTNLINGTQYVGDHSTDIINDNYLGSGIIFNKAKKKYGKEKFKCKILEFFSTKQEAFNAQEKYIIQFNTLVPNGYNVSPKGGLHVMGCHSEETKSKIGNANKGKITWIKGKHHSDESKEKIKNSHIGKKLSIIHKENIGKSSKKWHTDIGLSEESRKKISEKLTGRKLSIESKQKISNTQLGIKRSEEFKQKVSNSMKGVNIGKKHTEEAKKHMSEAAIKRYKLQDA